MGKRKRLMADRLKEAKKVTAVAKLNDVPTSPRKMRLVADTVRGVEVNRALDLLKFSKREASGGAANLIDQQREKNGNGEADEQVLEADDQRIAERAPEHGGCKHLLEVFPTHPGTARNAANDRKLAERNGDAAHGHVAENDIPDQHRQKQQVELPVFGDSAQKAPAQRGLRFR